MTSGTSRLGALLSALLPVLGPVAARAADFGLDGFLYGRGAEVASPVPWIEGGFGKLVDGRASDDFESEFQGEAQLGVDLRGGDVVRVHLHGVARARPDAAGGEQAGLVEAFVVYRPRLSDSTRLRIAAGTFFPPTSRENTAPLWSSPYTLTLSALNSWIAEEVRLTGLEVGVTHETVRDELLAAVTVFGANDTSGTLLAWRGWAMGDRLSTVGEDLPLPPLPTLEPGGAFGKQRAEGTRPIDELDDRPGFQARARWSRQDVALLQASYLDNRGDRGLHDGQYAWRTRMVSVGGEAHIGSRFVLVAEAARGDTGMGVETGPHVDLDFTTGYVLASWRAGSLRFSTRYDHFENEDRDGTAEPNQEVGDAVTLAILWEPTAHLRVGVEGLRLWNDRPAAAYSGADGDLAADRLLAEVRVRF